MTVDGRASLRFAGIVAAVATSALLVAGCEKSDTPKPEATSTPPADAHIAATLDGAKLEVPGPYTCIPTEGTVTATSETAKSPTVFVSIDQATSKVKMVTITSVGHSTQYTWSEGDTQNGSATVSKHGSVYTVTGELSEATYDSSKPEAAKLHPFRIEADCPGVGLK